MSGPVGAIMFGLEVGLWFGLSVGLTFSEGWYTTTSQIQLAIRSTRHYGLTDELWPDWSR